MKYEVFTTKTFTRWFKKVKDQKARDRILARIRMIQVDGNFADYASVGDGVSELRIFIGKGYRIYYGLQNEKMVLLLVGGIKDTQKRDIKKAKEVWANME